MMCLNWMVVYPLLVANTFWLTEAASIKSNDDTGYFWQVTDFHFDKNYTQHGDPNVMCHPSSSAIHYDLGVFGDYKCDSPWSLVTSAISSMKSIRPDPDFILWTGDSVPHVPDSQYNQTKVYTIISNVTNALMDHFNTSLYPIIPTFGNHDPYPTNQMDPNNEQYFTDVLSRAHWDKLIPPSANSTFHQGGYYSVKMTDKLTILSLNTALYYHSNNLTHSSNEYDPSGQLSWLSQQLFSARFDNKKVYIAAHVPPGAFELARIYKWFHEDMNEAYLDVIEKYTDVIVAHFYGHEHTDTFRLFDSRDSKRGNIMFLSPAVTPWKSSLPGVGSNNPSIRLYKYSKNSLEIQDYEQYYLNLSRANLEKKATWEMEYTFTEVYAVPDMTEPSVRQAIKNTFKAVAWNNTAWSRYLQYNSVSAKTNLTCDSMCHRNHLCAATQLRYHMYDQCMTQGPPHHTSTTPKHHHPHHPTNRPHRRPIPRTVIYAIYALSIAVFLLAIAVLVLCLKQRNRSSRASVSQLGYQRVPVYGSLGHRNSIPKPVVVRYPN